MNSLVAELTTCVENKFTGRLDIFTSKGIYKLYLGLGRLVWANCETHPNRRWRRNLRQVCPDLGQHQLKIRQGDEMDSWEYRALVILLQRGLIGSEQLLAIATGYVREVLFDLMQISLDSRAIVASERAIRAGNPYDFQNHNSFKIISHGGIRPAGNHILPSTMTLELGLAFGEVKQAWDAWDGVIGVDAVSISPNKSPVISKPEILAQKITAKAYKNLSILANGHYTIRDIAEVLQKKPWEVMNIFLPHIRNQEMALVEVPDLDKVTFTNQTISGDPSTISTGNSRISEETTKRKNNSLLPKTSSPPPLIACIDNSYHHCEILGKTLRGFGYDFLPILNEIEALPQLIAMTPSLVFLDLLMPIINGYELCTQIRRISRLENVPIIILTGKSSLVDRVRAKMAGATDFITKPITSEQLLETLQKYGVISDK